MDSSIAGPSGVKLMTRSQFYDIMKCQQHSDINGKLEHAEQFLLNSHNYSVEEVKSLKHKLSKLKSEIKRRWTESSYKEDLFLKRNTSWLQGTIEIPLPVVHSGRPTKSFSDSSERSKRRKTETARKEMSSEELTFASHMKLREEGKTDAANVIKDITQSPKRAGKYRKAFSHVQKDTGTEQLAPINALSMFVEAGLSRKQYEVIRSFNKKFYPCYSIIQNEKKKCYPKQESYQVTASCAEVNLQHLLDHTVTRLLKYLEEVIRTLNQDDRKKLILISKWGCDGSQQVQFKQKYDNEGESDANIFQCSFVPLQLVCGPDNKKVIWQNPVPSSARYCRPIRIRFVKETADVTNEEISYIENQIATLKVTEGIQENYSFSVEHKMILTMVDGKVCNAATSTKSTMKCYICGATSKDFNNLQLNKEINPHSLTFGLSILHARIRLFESLLHLAYKLPVKKWQLRTESDKQIVKERKPAIQEEFKRKIGLIVDMPKAGFGNSNDGNSSRRFFMDPDLSAQITGLDPRLVYRLKVILEAISSGYNLNTYKLDSYCSETAKLYVELYPWHPMTPTLHKILIHGPIVIEKALLPIGMLSEEAAEARNKHFRSYRMNYARKFSRESCNLDVINRLLLTSDPLITGMRPIPRKKSKPFLRETVDMFLAADLERDPSQDSPSDDSDRSDDSGDESEDSFDEETLTPANADIK